MNSTDKISGPKPDGEPKKQVRRRRRHSRPRRRLLYKEMPLDMAEARREIVSALKLHRASSTSSKEAKEQQQKQDQQSLPLFPQLSPCFEKAEGRSQSRRNPRIYPACCSYEDCSFYLEKNGSGFVVVAPPPFPMNLNTEINHPIQTFHYDVDTCSSFCSLPPSSYICPTLSCPDTHQDQLLPKSISLSEEQGKLMASDVFLFNNDPTGESEREMQQGAVLEEIRSMSMDDVKALEIDAHHSCDNPMELFPDWLSINDDFLQQHSNYQCVEYNLQDPGLSCFEMGKIEDVDGDWLASKHD